MVVFLDKKLIISNYSKEELDRLPRCKINVTVNQAKIQETSLVDILASDNIILEEEDELVVTTQNSNHIVSN